MSFHAHRDTVPHDRLTVLANEMLQPLRDTNGAEDVHAIVLLQDGENGGLALQGYESDDEETATHDAAVDLILHLRSMLEVSMFDLATVLMAAQRKGLL